MKYITTTQKLSIVAALFFVVVVFGYVSFFFHLKELRVGLRNLHGEIVVVENDIKNKNVVALLLEETKEGYEKLARYFVSHDDPTSFLALIEMVARDVGVVLTFDQITEISRGGEKNAPNFGSTHYEASIFVEGEWNALYHFLFLLERIPYVITLTRVSVTQGGETSSAVWSGQILIEYYTL